MTAPPWRSACAAPGRGSKRCADCRARKLENIAKSANADKSASTAFINGNALCHVKSTFAKSEGDEAGNCGGTKSGTIQQVAEFLGGSSSVMFQGKPAERQGDKTVSTTMRNTPQAALEQPGAGVPEASPLVKERSVESTRSSSLSRW